VSKSPQEEVVAFVREMYSLHGQGPTRQQIADHLGWPQTRNIPGVRAAIDAREIGYDPDDRVGRLVPREVLR
jgi:hypothetical protein